jgi:hypothetical protein
MEQAERVDMKVNEEARVERVYEKYGSMILAVSAIFGIVAAVMTTLPPLSWFIDPLYIAGYSIMGALAITWIGFNVLALVLILIPYRRDEQWAWYALWLLPLMWLFQFVLAPDLYYYLVLAVLSTVGLILPYRRFFSGTKDEGSV